MAQDDGEKQATAKTSNNGGEQAKARAKDIAQTRALASRIACQHIDSVVQG
jgi:hypothetical protein